MVRASKVVRIPTVPIRRASKRMNPSGTNEAIAGWSRDTKFSFLFLDTNFSSAATIARVEVVMETNCSSTPSSLRKTVLKAAHCVASCGTDSRITSATLRLPIIAVISSIASLSYLVAAIYAPYRLTITGEKRIGAVTKARI